MIQQIQNCSISYTLVHNTNTTDKYKYTYNSQMQLAARNCGFSSLKVVRSAPCCCCTSHSEVGVGLKSGERELHRCLCFPIERIEGGRKVRALCFKLGVTLLLMMKVANTCQLFLCASFCSINPFNP